MLQSLYGVYVGDEPLTPEWGDPFVEMWMVGPLGLQKSGEKGFSGDI